MLCCFGSFRPVDGCLGGLQSTFHLLDLLEESFVPRLAVLAVVDAPMAVQAIVMR
jgi:hypothetical protein